MLHNRAGHSMSTCFLLPRSQKGHPHRLTDKNLDNEFHFFGKDLSVFSGFELDSIHFSCVSIHKWLISQYR
jgi:hypothetical protein